MTVQEIIKTIAPEFDTIESSKIDAWISLAKPLVSKKHFGESYEHALALLVCHKMKVAGLGTDNGSGSVADRIGVSSYSEGSASVSYSVSQSTNMLADAELALTVYGVQFLSLRRAKILPIVIAGQKRC